MRITIVQGAFLPVPPIMGGAVEKIWFALGKEFARRGHEVTHVSRQHGRLQREEHIEGVNHVRVRGFDTPGSLVRLKWQDLIYSSRVLKVLPEADILVTNTFWLPIISADVGKGKIYVHVQRYPRGQMKLYGRAARLQTVSSVIYKAICRQAPKLASRVKIIPNFVSRIGSSPVSNSRSKCILYVGRIHPEKGIHLLIDAFARFLSMGFHDWKLRVVGPYDIAMGGGGERYFQIVRNRARTIEGFVDWTGPVFDPERLSSHYRESSIFVYPSLAERGEASPLAPIEAMAEGCPPILSSLECFRDYLRPDINGWVFDGDAQQGAANLANVLKRLASEADTLRRVSDGAYRTAQNYTLSKIAGQYLADFEEIAFA